MHQTRSPRRSAAARCICAGGLALASLAGCVKPPAAAESRLTEVKQQGIEMDKAFDSLEERLLGSQTNVELWQEMARRHQSVSEIACENANEHLKGMVKSLERQEEKIRSRRRSVASNDRALDQVAARTSKLRN